MKTDKKIAGQIPRIALRILEKEGPDSVSIRRIAREIGITPMAIYHYYPDRQALLKSVTDAEFDKLLAFYLARQKRTPPSRRLLTIMDGYLDYAIARPKLFDYVFCRYRAGARQFPDGFRSRQSPTLTPVADILTAAMQSGQLRPDDPWELALQLWALAHGYVTMYIAGRFNLTEQQFRRLVHRAIQRQLHGLNA